MNYEHLHNLKQKQDTAVPDSSIVGVKPIIEDIPVELIEQYKKYKTRIGSQGEKLKHCCICGQVPTKIAKYHIQGATRIEHYCDSCVNKVYEREPVL